VTWTNLQLAKHKTAPFCTQTSKNDFCVIIRIFETTKKLLNIFEKSLKQIKAMDHIYYFFTACLENLVHVPFFKKKKKLG